MRFSRLIACPIFLATAGRRVEQLPSISAEEQSAFIAELFQKHAQEYASLNLDGVYGEDDDLVWQNNPKQWHQQLARIVDHRFTTFGEFAEFAKDAKKAGTSALMLVQIQKTEACPGHWYNGLQLCDHINGSFPAADGSLEEWRSLLQELKPMRLMWWTNMDYWSIQGQVWQEALADRSSATGRFFSWNASDDQACCGGVNPEGAQGSWQSDGMKTGIPSALASWGSETYADYLVDAMANSWTRNLGIDGYNIDCIGCYECMLQTELDGGEGAWANIVRRVKKAQPQVVLSAEAYGSWKEIIKTESDIGGQGFNDYHMDIQEAVFSGDASQLEDIASTSGADAATVLCYLNPYFDGKQPGACPTMYFRDMTNTIADIDKHRMWVALEAASGIVSQHDYGGDRQPYWWNVSNDPSDEQESPLWAFTKYRALNRLALRTKLDVSGPMDRLSYESLSTSNRASPAWTYAKSLNCWEGHGGHELEPAGSSCGQMSVEECKAKCMETPNCTGITMGLHSNDCYRRSNIVLEKCDHNADFDSYVYDAPAPPPPPSVWTYGKSRNCWEGHGGHELDTSPFGQMPVEECKARCLETPNCNGITVDLGSMMTGIYDCYRRSGVWLKQCEMNSGFDSYVYGPPAPPPPPPVAGGALAYLKHDSMGPFGDAVIAIFNPGNASNVSVDLSQLPERFFGAVPYDLLGQERAAPPPLAKNWTVEMASGDMRFFGGFSLGVFAPRRGKQDACVAEDGYGSRAEGATLQACFLECLADDRCENVFVEYADIIYMEKPPPVSCRLLGKISNPSKRCQPGTGTLIKRLPGARSCADDWLEVGEIPPWAPGAPELKPGPPSSRCRREFTV